MTRKERTINGTPVYEVFQRLKEEIPEGIGWTDEAKPKPYLRGTKLRMFFESIVPRENYDFEVRDLQLHECKGKAVFSCIGTLILYDDAGEKIVSKSYVGSYNVNESSSGVAIDLAMCARNAAGSAKKQCIIEFGCGEEQLARAKTSQKNSGGNSGGNSLDSSSSMQETSKKASPTNPKGPQEHPNVPPLGTSVFQLCFDKKLKVIDASKYYLVPVKCLGYQNYSTTLLLWKDRVTNAAELVSRMQTADSFFVKGKYEPYNTKHRIIFERMEGGDH